MKTAIKLVLIYVGIQILSGLLAAILCMTISLIRYGNPNGLANEMVLIAMILGFVGMTVYLWKAGYISKEKETWSPVSDGYLGVTVVIALASIFLLDYLMQHMSWLHNIMEDTFMQLQSSWLGILCIALLGPVVEELLFRGAITKALLKQYSPATAIVVSALIFGIIHINPAQIAGAFLIGLLLGWLYYKTASLIPVILVHVLNNSLSIYLSERYSATDTMRSITENDTLYYSCLALALVAFVVSFLFLKGRKANTDGWKV